MMLVYALVDPRTNRVRYIGKSEHGLLRPLSHGVHTHDHSNKAVKAWLYDMKVCGVGYTVLILAEASTAEQLSALEAYWINTGTRFSWPLCNISGVPRGPSTEELPIPLDPSKRWSAKAWRRDPDVQKRLAEARASRKK